MRILIITQKVDLDDPLLGFFHRWLEEFAEHTECVHVVCLEEGRHTLPQNVAVTSLGKERGASRLEYLATFYHYASHRDLASVDAETIEREVREDKLRIERQIGRPITHFAYPSGMQRHVDERSVAAVGAAGYRYAFTSTIDFAEPAKGALRVSRTIVDPDMPLWLMRLWIMARTT